MKKRVWINLVMVILVAGLFFTISCAKKTIVSDATATEDQDKAGLEADAKSASDAAEAERIRSQNLAEQMAKKKAMQAAKFMAEKKLFEDQDIHFEFDSSKLSPLAKTLLKQKADWLRANNLVSVKVEGHCDERGTTEYNLALGDRRAYAAAAYLTNLGVSASRLSTVSYGEEKPLDTGKTEIAYAKNRRAHFVIE